MVEMVVEKVLFLVVQSDHAGTMNGRFFGLDVFRPQGEKENRILFNGFPQWKRTGELQIQQGDLRLQLVAITLSKKRWSEVLVALLLVSKIGVWFQRPSIGTLRWRHIWS